MNSNSVADQSPISALFWGGAQQPRKPGQRHADLSAIGKPHDKIVGGERNINRERFHVGPWHCRNLSSNRPYANPLKTHARSLSRAHIIFKVASFPPKIYHALLGIAAEETFS
jgi:hypothetical protein